MDVFTLCCRCWAFGGALRGLVFPVGLVCFCCCFDVGL